MAGAEVVQQLLVLEPLTPLVGGVAALLASLSYIPQVGKAWPRGETKDLSLGMLIALTAGLWLWVVYGVLKGDFVIIIANGLATILTGTVLGCKLRDIFFY